MPLPGRPTRLASTAEELASSYPLHVDALYAASALARAGFAAGMNRERRLELLRLACRQVFAPPAMRLARLIEPVSTLEQRHAATTAWTCRGNSS
jgi:hypothetical protein